MADMLPEVLRGARFTLHPEPFAIVGLPEGAPEPAPGPWVSVLRTGPERTAYLPEAAWDPHAPRCPGARVSRGWRLLSLEASMPWDTPGVLAALTGALAARGIPCAALPSFETDHLLVPAARLDEGLAALQALAQAKLS
jgi:hypothetical protein